jgi:hypothetical protein
LTPGGSSTAHIWLTPGGSSTAHIYSYTQTVHTRQRMENLEVPAVPCLCELYPGICLTDEEKARRNVSYGSTMQEQWTVTRTMNKVTRTMNRMTRTMNSNNNNEQSNKNN